MCVCVCVWQMIQVAEYSDNMRFGDKCHYHNGYTTTIDKIFYHNKIEWTVSEEVCHGDSLVTQSIHSISSCCYL